MKKTIYLVKYTRTSVTGHETEEGILAFENKDDAMKYGQTFKSWGYTNVAIKETTLVEG